jgi:hypothetical protein
MVSEGVAVWTPTMWTVPWNAGSPNGVRDGVPDDPAAATNVAAVP